jgi:hypothetical protein
MPDLVKKWVRSGMGMSESSPCTGILDEEAIYCIGNFGKIVMGIVPIYRADNHQRFLQTACSPWLGALALPNWAQR